MATKKELIKQELRQTKESLIIFVNEINVHEDQNFILANIQSLVKRFGELQKMMEK